MGKPIWVKDKGKMHNCKSRQLHRAVEKFHPTPSEIHILANGQAHMSRIGKNEQAHMCEMGTLHAASQLQIETIP